MISSHVFLLILFFLIPPTEAQLPPRCITCSGPCPTQFTSAGVFDTLTFNVEACVQTCVTINYGYAATFFSYCFCVSSSVNVDAITTIDSNCINECAANGTDQSNSASCGGMILDQRFMSLYEASATPRYLAVNISSSKGIGNDQTPMEFQAAADSSYNSLALVYNTLIDSSYRPLTPYSLVDKHSVLFSKAGRHTLAFEFNNKETRASYLEIDGVVSGSLLLHCPEAWLYGKELECNLTVNIGSGLQLSVDFGDSSQDAFLIADPEIRAYGADLEKMDGLDANTFTTFHYPYTFEEDGLMTTLQAEMMSGLLSRVLIVEIYEPTTGITLSSDEVTCAAPNLYCLLTSECGVGSSCPAQDPPQNLQLRWTGSSSLVNSVTLPVPDASSNVVQFPSPLAVKAGQSFSIVDVSLGVGKRPVKNNERSWIDSSNAYVYMLNVLVWSRKSISVFHEYFTEGVLAIKAEVFNYRYPSFTPITNTTFVEIQAAINDSTIIAPSSWPINETLILTLKPHTGIGAMYTWNITDRADDINTTLPTLSLQFTAIGCQKITCFTFNKISEMMSNETQVCVEEYVDGLSVQNSDVVATGADAAFTVTLLQGNLYVCTWNHGNGDIQNVTEAEMTSASNVHTYMYTLPGLYSIVVRCFNNISSTSFQFDQLVELPITNLRLVTKGALKNTLFKIEFMIDAGSRCSFNLTVDGGVYPVVWDGVNMNGSTSSVVGPYASNLIIPVVIWGSNYLGTVKIKEDFYIETPITDVKLSCGPQKVNHSEVVTCTGSVATGSSLHYQFYFDDSTPETNFTLPFYSPSPSQQLATHSFQFAGYYNVSLSVSSNAENITANFVVRVVGTIANVIISEEVLTPKLINVFDPIPRYQNEFCFIFSSPVDLLNMFVDINFGDGAVSTKLDFNLNQQYCHLYANESTYEMKYKVYDGSSSGSFNFSVIILTPISLFSFVYDLPAAGFKWTYKFGVRMETGSKVTLVFDFGDGTPPITVPRLGRTFVEPDLQYHVYNKTGTYFIKVYAYNLRSSFNSTYELQVQYPLTNSFLLLDNSPIPSSSGLLNITLFYPANLQMPQAVTVVTDYAEPSNYPITIQLDWLIAPPITLTPAFIATLFSTSTSPPTTDLFYSFNFLYTYQTPGLYDLVIFMHNLASNVTYNITVAVLTPITDLHVVYLHHPANTPPTNLVAGFGVDNMQFPLGSPIICKPQFKGTLLSAQLKVTNTDTLSSTTFFFMPDQPFQFSVTEVGTYSVQLTLSNDFGPAVSSSSIMSSHIPNTIALQASPSSARPFQNFNIIISFDDFNALSSCLQMIIVDDVTLNMVHSEFYGTFCNPATTNLLTNPMTIPQTLPYLGNYQVTAIYNDPVVTDMKTPPVLLTASNEDCSRPQVNIVDKKQYWFDPASFLFSHIVTFKGQAILACSDITSNTKVWSVYQVDPSSGTTLKQVNEVSSFLSHSSSSLFLPAKFLPVGLYMALYNVSMKVPGFYQTVSSFFQIIGSPIIASLTASGLSSFSLGNKDTLKLSPSFYSIDPDVPMGTQKFDSFLWYCRLPNESLPLNPDGTIQSTAYKPIPTITSALVLTNRNLGGCFSFGPGNLGFEGGSLQLPGSVFRLNESYVFRCTVTAGGRQDSDEVRVDVVEGSVPLLEMGCSDSTLCRAASGYKVISSTSNLKVYSKCVERCQDGLVFKWTGQKLTLANQWIDIPHFQEEFILGTNINEVMVDKVLFKKSLDYVEAISNTTRLRISATSAGSKATIEFEMSRPPSGGSCQVSPSTGTVMKTLFDFSCTGWHSEYAITEYAFYLRSPFDETTKMELGGSADGILVGVDLPSSPQGDGPSSWQVWVDVRDELGSVTNHHSDAPLQVNAMSAKDLDDLLNSLAGGGSGGGADINDVFVTLSAQGNIVAMCQFFTTLADALNTDLNNKMNEYGGGQPYPNALASSNEAYQQSRDRNAQIRAKMLEAMNTVTPISMEEIGMLTSSLALITSVPSELSRGVQAAALERMDSLMDTFDILNGDASIESLESVATGITSFIGNLLAGANFGIEDGTLSDIEEAAEGPNYYYDTDYNSPRAELPADPLQALKVLRKETNAIEQKSSAKRLVGRLNSMITTMSGVLRGRIVAGLPPITIQTPNLDISLSKIMLADLETHGLNTRSSVVGFPPWKEIWNDEKNDKTVAAKPVSLQLVATKKNIFQFFLNTQQVPVDSSIVSLDVFDDSGDVKKITGSKTPLTIAVGRSVDFPPPAKLNFSEAGKFQAQMVYFAATVTGPYSSIHVIIANNYTGKLANITLNYTLHSYSESGTNNNNNVSNNSNNSMVAVGNWPVLMALSSFDIVAEQNGSLYSWKHMQLLPTIVDDTLSYSFNVPSHIVGKSTGQWFVGVRLLDASELQQCLRGEVTELVGKVTTELVPEDIVVAIYTSACNHNPNNGLYDQWDIDESCKVSRGTTPSGQVCECTHLTSFGGSFAVQPNKIDMSFVLQNSSFAQNMTLYLTEIFICVIYLIVLVWARYQDKKDVLKSGLTPLLDNDLHDKYLYEVVICTGMRRNAGTDSKVRMIVAGELEETETRCVEDGIRKTFTTGAVDQFLMSVPRPLGDLLYLKIWHDNSGKKNKAGWFLDSVSIRDVQTSQKYFFLVDSWLALEYGDGQISKLVSLAGQQQLTVSKHIFNKKAAKGLVDDHLWFSIVSSRASSRFTRVQRLSCCLCLLFSVMFANAMFYGTTSSSSPNKLDIGPISLSLEQIYVGFISNLVVFPINFIIVLLFKKSRDRAKKVPRVRQALNIMQERAGKSGDGEDEGGKKGVDGGNKGVDGGNMGEDGEKNLNEEMKGEELHRGECIDNDDIDDDGVVSEGVVEEKHSDETKLVEKDVMGKEDNVKEKKKKKKKFMLPWWFKIVAWVLLWLAVTGGVAGVTFYGIMFQDEKVKKWLTSLVISIITSIFFTQPIKILLVALLFALIFKKPLEDESEEEEEEEEDKLLGADEEWAHERVLIAPVKPKGASFPDPVNLRSLRETRVKEMQLQAALKEIFLYGIFLWATISVSYHFRQPADYYVKLNLQKIFSADEIGWEVKTMDDFWVWLEGISERGLRSEKWYNGKQPIGLRGHLVDTVSRLMGFATLRQLRVKRNACKVVSFMRKFVDTCNVPYSFMDEDMGDYLPGWMPMQNVSTLPSPLNSSQLYNNNSILPTYRMAEFEYRNASSLDSLPVFVTHALYRGGGYVAEMKGSVRELMLQVARLKASRWIDQYTRAVFLEFSVYNVHSNLFGIVTVVFELMNTGGFDVYERVDSVNLLTSGSLIFYLSFAIYVLFTIYYSVFEVKLLLKLRLGYFRLFWSWVEIINLALSMGSVAIYVIRFFSMQRILKVFNHSGGNAYIRLQGVAAWHDMLVSFVAMVVFFSTLKLIKILRFNKNIGLFGSTLSYASRFLFSFCIIFCIVFFAFVQLFYLVYIQNLVTFSSFLSATQQCLQMLVGKFDFQDMRSASPYFGTFIFFAYMTILAFVLLTLFITIVTEAFQTVRSNVQKQSNEHEVVDFMVKKLKEAIGSRIARGNNRNSVMPSMTSHEVNKQFRSLESRLDGMLRLIGQQEEVDEGDDVIKDLLTSGGKMGGKKVKSF